MKPTCRPPSRKHCGMEDKFRFRADADDVRIDVYLSERLSLPRSKVKRLIEEGHVRVGDKVPKSSFKVRRDVEIEGEIVAEGPVLLVAEDIPVSILYEDDYLLVIDKPKDMVVHPSLGHARGTLVNAILSYLKDVGSGDERPGIVHRLDRGTTGVIIVAKDARTQEALSRQFHDRIVEKTYRAVVEGAVRTDVGVVEGQIGRHPTDRKRMDLVTRGGRYSFSRYKVLERLKGFTYVEVYPKTGQDAPDTRPHDAPGTSDSRRRSLREAGEKPGRQAAAPRLPHKLRPPGKRQPRDRGGAGGA